MTASAASRAGPERPPAPPAALPLAGCRVLERSRSVAAAYAGRLLATLGARVLMLEPPGGSPLRRAAPRIEPGGESALFAYLAAGKRSLECDTLSDAGRQRLRQELQAADLLLDDTPLAERGAHGLQPQQVAECAPRLIHVSVLPFGASGPKAAWDGEEVNLLHAGGEGYLLPNGYAQELFPERPPLKIYGPFAGYQGGCLAALSALSAWWKVDTEGGRFVDVSVQDAVLAVGAFALQRLGDGSLEHRATRKFRYGGVFQARDGFVEILTLEDRQWEALLDLLQRPAWSADPALRDPLERSRRGDQINRHIRVWMAGQDVDQVVRRAQQLGVPAARYRAPDEVLGGEHEAARGLFADIELPLAGAARALRAPYQFLRTPLPGGGRVPRLGEGGQP